MGPIIWAHAALFNICVYVEEAIILKIPIIYYKAKYRKPCVYCLYLIFPTLYPSIPVSLQDKPDYIVQSNSSKCCQRQRMTLLQSIVTIILVSSSRSSSSSSCPSMSSVPVISSSDAFLSSLSWPGYGENACEVTDENHGAWFKDPCEIVSEWPAGENMTDFFE